MTLPDPIVYFAGPNQHSLCHWMEGQHVLENYENNLGEYEDESGAFAVGNIARYRETFASMVLDLGAYSLMTGPMLPVTHGKPYTRLQVLLYTLILFAVSLLPYVIRMSGLLYLVAALVLGGIFLAYAVRIYVAYSDALAQKTFRYSIAYLAFLFAALLVDHYL